MNGVFFIDKEAGCTSRDVVNEVIKKVETNKVGHTGTLDPMATGVLVVCVGKATKLVDLLSHDIKEYEAEITLGIDTDTYDITGNILKDVNTNVTLEQVNDILNSFKGTYEQEVPIYSAVKINGKKLYEYARENKKVNLPKRKVTIYDIEIVSPIEMKNNKQVFSIKTTVSKGTYIRSLVHDIANKLNTCGVMSNLRRTKLGNVTINDCVSIDNLEISNIVSIKNILKDYLQVIVSDELKKDILNGKIIDNKYNEDFVLFLDNNNSVLALYKIYDKDNTKIKPYIMFGGV